MGLMAQVTWGSKKKRTRARGAQLQILKTEGGEIPKSNDKLGLEGVGDVVWSKLWILMLRRRFEAILKKKTFT